MGAERKQGRHTFVEGMHCVWVGWVGWGGGGGWGGGVGWAGAGRGGGGGRGGLEGWQARGALPQKAEQDGSTPLHPAGACLHPPHSGACQASARHVKPTRFLVAALPELHA